MFEYLECLMNGIKKIGGDDIEMPKRTRPDSELICMLSLRLLFISILSSLARVLCYLRFDRTISSI